MTKSMMTHVNTEALSINILLKTKGFKDQTCLGFILVFTPNIFLKDTDVHKPNIKVK